MGIKLDEGIEINQKTKINLYWVLGLVPPVVYLSFFLSSLSFRASALEVKTVVLEQKLDSQMLMLMNIRESQIRMEANKGRK